MSCAVTWHHIKSYLMAQLNIIFHNIKLYHISLHYIILCHSISNYLFLCFSRNVNRLSWHGEVNVSICFLDPLSVLYENKIVKGQRVRKVRWRSCNAFSSKRHCVVSQFQIWIFKCTSSVQSQTAGILQRDNASIITDQYFNRRNPLRHQNCELWILIHWTPWQIWEDE